jgi:predicted transcriptional regulator
MQNDDRTFRIALISPKGPLYRHRGGIFRKSLRYQPLTLTTLAAHIGISQSTVHVHIKHLCRQFAVKGRIELMAMAIRKLTAEIDGDVISRI